MSRGSPSPKGLLPRLPSLEDGEDALENESTRRAGMLDFFVWCAHCGDPHEADTEVCPKTGMLVMGGEYPSGSQRASGKARIGGRYVIRDPIGEGGTGTVFEAERCSDGAIVAIKILKPKTHSAARPWRLHREAQLAGSVLHPKVCRVFEIGILEGGAPYLVMERLVGETLRARLRRQGRLDLEDAVGIFVQVLSGLSAAHDLGIVHRDVTPQNIFLLEGFEHPPLVKLLDFGLSKRVENEDGDVDTQAGTGTMTGVAVGTLPYMPPEQARAEGVDARVDLYACGVSFYEALTGRRPFEGSKSKEIASTMTDARFPLPSELRPELPTMVDFVVTRAVAANRSDRFTDARDFILALANLLDEVDTVAGDPLTVDIDVDVAWSSGSTDYTATDKNQERRPAPPTESSDEELTVPDLRRR